MEIFDVLVTETRQATYEIEAPNKEVAFEQAKRNYFDEHEKIGVDDSVRVDIEIYGEEIQIDNIGSNMNM